MKNLLLWKWAFIAVVFLFSIASLPLRAQTLNLRLDNLSAYSASDVYFTFSVGGVGSDSNLPSFFSGSYGVSGSYTPIQMLWTNSYQYTQSSSPDGGTTWITNTFNSSQNALWSQSLSLATILGDSGTGSLLLEKAASARVYVSLGAPLTVTAPGMEQNRAIVTAGSPSYSATIDPNWNTRWDLFEVTVTPAVSDQGDVTAINGIAIPMMMQSFKSGTVVQVTQNSANWDSLVASLTAYTAANAGNNTYIPVNTNPTPVVFNGSGTTPDDILRIIGINNGQQIGVAPIPDGGGTIFVPAPGLGGIATIGANATFGDYVNFVQSNSIITPLQNRNVMEVGGGTFFGFSATTYGSAWTSSSVITASWQNSSSVWNSGTIPVSITGGTGAALVVEGQMITSTAAPNGVFNITGTLGAFKMIVPPDYTGNGTYSNYLQSAFLYSSDPGANFGLIFEYTPLNGVTSTYLSYQDFANAINPTQGAALTKQVVHDLAAGYNLGLIGSGVIDPATGMTFNDEGSYYWTNIWEKLAGMGSGTFNFDGTEYWEGKVTAWGTIGNVPLYDQLQGTANGFYNQWAYEIWKNTPIGYGNPYSDYLQRVDVNLLASPNQVSYDIDYVLVTIIPEASTFALLLAAGGVFATMKFRQRKSQKPQRDKALS